MFEHWYEPPTETPSHPDYKQRVERRASFLADGFFFSRAV
jgi:hypothetical protein